jgi:arylsulfatase A-like enzyme
MADDPNPDTLPSRRTFLATTAGAAAAPLLSALPPRSSSHRPSETARRAANLAPPFNIVFVFTDQERYRTSWPAGVTLPAHERLQRDGVTFQNHYCPAVMCTSSRAVLLTGLTTPDNRMFENADVPWVKALSPDVPTIGHMLRKAGYYTAYKGKWHLNALFDSEEPDRLFTQEMEEYGFADYRSPGDLIGHTLGGYQFDPLIASSAITWLRRNGRPLADQNRPWCLFVSLVNPHDIMYFNTDAPGQHVQDNGRLMSHAAPAPRHELYTRTWDVTLPDSLRQPFDATGRPAAHGEFDKVWDSVLGNIPPEEARWRRFHDFYINSIRAVDAHLLRVLEELDALDLTSRTIFVFTSDHGELGGAHGLRGKGPFAYEEGIHLPFHIVHPDVKGNQQLRAVTSHIDVVPTLLSMAGVDAARRGEIAGRQLPGHDIAPALGSPRAADLHAVRDGALFTYSGLGTNDATLWQDVAAAKAAGKDPKAELKKQGFKPDLRKRGTLRTIVDGRYKFTRYFSPVERNRPANLDDLYRSNDVELFDLQTDPGEMVNLAADRQANQSLVLEMSNKLEALIKAEIGADDGREMPDLPNVSWTIDRVDL